MQAHPISPGVTLLPSADGTAYKLKVCGDSSPSHSIGSVFPAGSEYGQHFFLTKYFKLRYQHCFYLDMMRLHT